ncbi:MAG: hypothetical protein GX288_02390 [Clostridiales bacterium]|nr:hypothetical protein [Clostridiales bacterium]
MNKVVAIYDTDATYATRFTDYLNNKKDFDFDCYGFTKLEHLKEYLLNNPVEILLMGGNMDNDLSLDNIKYILKLSEYPNKLINSPYPEIYKYQSMYSILSEIISYYANHENNSQNFSYDINTKLISVYSPISGISKQIFTWSMAMILSEKIKTLLVSLEQFPVISIAQGKNNRYPISELIYYLKDDNPNLIMLMKALIQHYGKLSFLSGVSHGFDLLSITKEDISKWLEQIRLYTDYQAVIFHIGFYNEAMMKLMQQCKTIYLVNDISNYEEAVVQEWKRQTAYVGLKLTEEKLLKVNIPNRAEHVELRLEDMPQSTIWNIAMEEVALLMKTLKTS